MLKCLKTPPINRLENWLTSLWNLPPVWPSSFISKAARLAAAIAAIATFLCAAAVAATVAAAIAIADNNIELVEASR